MKFDIYITINDFLKKRKPNSQEPISIDDAIKWLNVLEHSGYEDLLRFTNLLVDFLQPIKDGGKLSFSEHTVGLTKHYDGQKASEGSFVVTFGYGDTEITVMDIEVIKSEGKEEYIVYSELNNGVFNSDSDGSGVAVFMTSSREELIEWLNKPFTDDEISYLQSQV